jgi:DNA (cytosine-5)-methyltransferase 1
VTYRVLSLFAGIGGFDLGLERTGGFKTVAFCEIDPFCQRVLAKHWPEVPCYDDVRTLTADRLAADGIFPTAVVGGFPCQDISLAGSGRGLEGDRSGLWSEFRRLIGEIRPAIVILENSAALVDRGLRDILGQLADIRYDAEWHPIPAAAVGADHFRNRLWVVAHPNEKPMRPRWVAGVCYRSKANRTRLVSAGGSRAAHGVPDWLDRVGACGNAVHPVIPELIGRAILAAEQDQARAA